MNEKWLNRMINVGLASAGFCAVMAYKSLNEKSIFVEDINKDGRVEVIIQRPFMSDEIYIQDKLGKYITLQKFNDLKRDSIEQIFQAQRDSLERKIDYLK